MKTELNRMGRIRLFPLLFQNDCSQSSRFLPQARRIVSSGDENVSGIGAPVCPGLNYVLWQEFTRLISTLLKGCCKKGEEAAPCFPSPSIISFRNELRSLDLSQLCQLIRPGQGFGVCFIEGNLNLGIIDF